jgi:hypothetical protein
MRMAMRQIGSTHWIGFLWRMVIEQPHAVVA